MNNPLKTRSDLGKCLIDLLEPLKKYSVPGGFHLGNTAAHYSPKIAEMEGWSRCLWGIGPYMAGGGKLPGIDELLATLNCGVDPRDDAYWGECDPKDQRLVEMAAIAMCLLLVPEVFWEPLSETAKQNLYNWLSQIEKCELPPSNWGCFRLFVCAAFRSLGLPVNEEAERESIEIIESCYKGDGWYQDSKDSGFDFYNPMGFHFYSLVLAAFAGRQDSQRKPEPSAEPERRGSPPEDHSDVYKRYIERAKEFGQRFSAWFQHDGSLIPYGRSLSYRFAAVSFYSACAFAGLEVIPWGEMKGIVLRHLRHWFSQPIFDSAGILSIGFNYPNLIMADTYNSPGSPYWGLKAFLVLALGEDHPFWQAEELPLPVQALCVSEKTAGFIINRSAEDSQILAGSVFPSWDMNHAAQKYSKFAYSARFGFCVSHSNYGIDKCSCDSTLLLSDGNDYWRERREILDREVGENWVKSRWQPWPDVDIITTLIRHGDWHVRIHRIQSDRRLQAVEGGFSVSCLEGLRLAKPVSSKAGKSEAAIAFPSAASRIVALDEIYNKPADSSKQVDVRIGELIKPAPNLNIIHPLVMVPVLRGKLEQGYTVWVTAVRAGDSEKVFVEEIPKWEDTLV